MQPVLPFGWGMMQRHLTANESHFLSKVRPCSGRVENEFIAHRSSEQVIDRFLPEFPEKIPQGEVNAAYRIQYEPLATVEQSRQIHLIPDTFHVSDVGAFQESRQVRIYDPCCGFSAGSHGETNDTVVCFNLHDERAKHIQSERLPAGAISRIFGH